jgi:hypothetical protein
MIVFLCFQTKPVAIAPITVFISLELKPRLELHPLCIAALKEVHQVLTDVELQPYISVVAFLQASLPEGRLPRGVGTFFSSLFSVL